MLAVDQSGETAWAFTDQLGSVTTWGTYDSGNLTTPWLLEHVAFDVFGNRDAALSSATPLPVGGQPLPQLWAGHQYEQALDLYHMQARWYDPHSGRFLSPDPLSYAAGDDNLYRYVGNNTTTFVDPRGLANFWNIWTWDIHDPNSTWGHFFNPIASENVEFWMGGARGGVNTVKGAGTMCKEIGYQAVDVAGSGVEIASGGTYHHNDWSGTAQALNSGQLGIGQYYGETVGNITSFGVYG